MSIKIPIDPATGEEYQPGEVPPGWNEPVPEEDEGDGDEEEEEEDDA